MNTAPVVASKSAPVFEFEELAMLPCGCVTAAYRAHRWGVSLVSIEAKGPFCGTSQHFVGQVVELGDDGNPGDLFEALNPLR